MSLTSPADTNRMTPLEWRASSSLASIFALRMLGLFLILPVFSVYAHQLPGGQSEFLVGLTLGIYGLTQGILQIPFGIMSDRYGRKPIIIIGLVLFAIGSFTAALGSNIYIVLLGRAIQGAGAISAAVTAMIADSVRDHVITKAMALVGASIGLTFALSLVVAPPITAHIGVPGLFAITGTLSIIAIGVIKWVVPTSPYREATVGKHQPWQNILFNPQLLRLNAGIFFLHAAQMALFVVIPVRLVNMGLPVLHHWYIYLPAVLIGFACMIKPISWAERHAKVTTLMRIMISLLIVVFALFFFLMHSIWEIAFLLTLFFMGFNILEATLPGMISKCSPKADKGLALGIYNTTQSLGLFVGGAAGGWLSQHLSPESVFIASTCAMVLWLVLAKGMKEPIPARVSGEAIKI